MAYAPRQRTNLRDTAMIRNDRLRYGERCPECRWATVGRFWARPWYRLWKETPYLACQGHLCGARQRERDWRDEFDGGDA